MVTRVTIIDAPSEGQLHGRCEHGEMLFVLRGIKFRADLPDGPSRGYVCENYGLPLRQVEHQYCRADLEDRFNFTRP
ncbi:MAG: homogentisate 1,2-dioxygenase, partial [Alphaproteobacteria bacterium]|nr:homogentisate 1,2-dioxygenase [Alphaproteobacteria bacterium]